MGEDMIVLDIGGSIAPTDVPGLCERLRGLLDGSDADLVVCEVGALRQPDAVAVDAVARLQLTARRLGRSIGLCHASGELRDLLELSGLGDVVAPSARLRLGPWGQAEEREQSGGVEEEGHAGDPVA